MRVILQRVTEANVTIGGEIVGEIKAGLLLLVGITHSDTEEDVKYLAEKIINLRVFADERGNMNKSLLDVNGEILSISQFTVYGDTRKGRRPSFGKSAPRDHAEELYDKFNQELKKYKLTLQTGFFGADMQVKLINDGPVTLIVDSATN